MKSNLTRIKTGALNNGQAVNMFLRNIVIYQRLFGILYLQPYYVLKLLLNPTFPDGEKVFKLIKDLYIRTSANSEKNLTYLMLVMLTLLKFEKIEIIQMNLHLSVLDLYSLKVYNLIVGSIESLSDYFDDLKRDLLTELIIVVQEKTAAAATENRNQAKSMVGGGFGFSGFGAAQAGLSPQNLAGSMIRLTNLDQSNNKQTDEPSSMLERQVFLRILDKFLLLVETDFKRIDLNLKIVPVPLVHLNNCIAQQIRDSKTYNNIDDKKSFAGNLKSFIVEIFFSSFFENLPKKDEVWDLIVEDKSNGMTEAMIGLITEVINVFSSVFQKKTGDTTFERWIDDAPEEIANIAVSRRTEEQNAGSARSGNSQSDKDHPMKKMYLDKIKTITELIYEAIAATNADGYDICERNLVQNIKHSYSDSEDLLTLTTAEMMSYKSLFIDIYRNRDKYRPFFSDDITFQDPFRNVLHYLSHDDLETVAMELNDEMETVNLCIANKFFETLNPGLDKIKQRKCTTSGIVLPTYLLKETDRMYIYELETKGWPCIIKPRTGPNAGRPTIHNNNDLAFLNCTGYSEETSKVQKRCDLYVNQLSLELSSIFDKISIYSLFPNEPDDISAKFSFLEFFMNLLKSCPDFDSRNDLLRLLTASENVVHEGKPSEYERLMTKFFKKDKSFQGITEKVRSIFLTGLDTKRMDAISLSICNKRLRLLTDKVSQYLDYIENHKQYQERCSQYLSVIANTIRDEINLIERNNIEILRSIFSLMDDLVERQANLRELFKGVMKEDEHKDDEITETELANLVKILDNINNNISVEQYTLFRLESEGIIMNFSFVKQSKFFDM
jgi:hypothetical protein